MFAPLMAIRRTPAAAAPAPPGTSHFAPRRQAVEAEEQGLGRFAGEPPRAPRLGETGAHQRPGEPRQAGNTGRIARRTRALR